MSKPTGGPAFPYSALTPDPALRQLAPTMYADNQGMSLRDYFAGQTLSGLLLARGGVGWQANIVEEAYALADAMLLEREKGESS